MKKILCFKWLICLFAFTVLLSCDKDDSYDPTTVEQDRENIRASFDKTRKLLDNFAHGKLFRFGKDFLDFHEEYVGGTYYGYYETVISDFVELMGRKLDESADFGKIEREKHFNMASFAGKYTWDNARQQWKKTTYNSVLAEFPSAEGGANNCELAITEYTDKDCNIEGEKVYLPTKASVYLKKDGEKLFSADVSGSYTSYGIPKQVTADIYAQPVSIQASLKEESASKYSATLAIKDETDAKNNLSVSGEITLSNAISQYTDIDDCKPKTLLFKITQSDMTINGSIDLEALNKAEGVNEINNSLNLEVIYLNQKIGTLSIKEETEKASWGTYTERYLYITYKDGAQENTSIYLDDFVEEVESIFQNAVD